MKNDLAYLAIMIAFFAVAALFVVACDKIIGSDEEAFAVDGEGTDPISAPEERAA